MKQFQNNSAIIKFYSKHKELKANLTATQTGLEQCNKNFRINLPNVSVLAGSGNKFSSGIDLHVIKSRPAHQMSIQNKPKFRILQNIHLSLLQNKNAIDGRTTIRQKKFSSLQYQRQYQPSKNLTPLTKA